MKFWIIEFLFWGFALAGKRNLKEWVDDYDDDDYELDEIGANSTCDWTDTETNTHFDLTNLTVVGDEKSYTHDGYPFFDYVWNVCGPVTTVSLPDICVSKEDGNEVHAVYQVYEEGAWCSVIGKYFSQDDATFSLIDASDPSQGVMITYLRGDKCKESGTFRTASVDIYCENVALDIKEAEESEMCDYHMVGGVVSCAVHLLFSFSFSFLIYGQKH